MLAVLSGLAKLLSSLAVEDGCWPRRQGTDCLWVTFVEVALGVENGNCLCATFDVTAFCVESRAAAFDEIIFDTDEVNCCDALGEVLGAIFDEITLGIEDVTPEINCCGATFDDEVTLRTVVTADGATVEDNCWTATFDEVTTGAERWMLYTVPTVDVDVLADATVLLIPFTVAGEPRLYDASWAL